MVTLRQRACVDEVVRQSALLPLSDYGIGKGAGNSGQRLSNFIQTDGVVRCRSPFFSRKVSGDILAGTTRICDRNCHLLLFFRRKRLKGLEDAILIHGL